MPAIRTRSYSKQLWIHFPYDDLSIDGSCDQSFEISGYGHARWTVRRCLRAPKDSWNDKVRLNSHPNAVGWNEDWERCKFLEVCSRVRTKWSGPNRTGASRYRGDPPGHIMPPFRDVEHATIQAVSSAREAGSMNSTSPTNCFNMRLSWYISDPVTHTTLWNAGAPSLGGGDEGFRILNTTLTSSTQSA